MSAVLSAEDRSQLAALVDACAARTEFKAYFATYDVQRAMCYILDNYGDLIAERAADRVCFVHVVATLRRRVQEEMDLWARIDGLFTQLQQ